jgi:hypothetical protein
MKYFVFLFLFFAQNAYAGIVNNPIIVDVDDVHFTCTGDETWFEIDGTYPPDNCGGGVSFPSTGEFIVNFYEGDCGDRVFNCSGINDTGSLVATLPFRVYGSLEEYEIATNEFNIMMTEGDNVMSVATGQTMGANVSWVGDNFIKLFIGSGLALLSGIVGWIIALVIIGAIVYFAYRAFRFFRH